MRSSSNLDCSRFTFSSTLHNGIFTGFPWVVSSPNLLWSLSGSLTFWVRISWFPWDKLKQPQTSLLFYFFNAWTSVVHFHYHRSHIQIYKRVWERRESQNHFINIHDADCCTDPAQTDTWKRCIDENLWRFSTCSVKVPSWTTVGNFTKSYIVSSSTDLQSWIHLHIWHEPVNLILHPVSVYFVLETDQQTANPADSVDSHFTRMHGENIITTKIPQCCLFPPIPNQLTASLSQTTQFPGCNSCDH